MTKNGPVSAPGSYISTMEGLMPDTKYYARAYIQNSGTVEYSSNVLSFRTLSAGLPVVTTGIILDLTTSSATISGSLNSLGDGASSVTQHGHCWSSETATPTIDVNNKSSLGPRDSTGSFQSLLVGLSPDVLYYVRAYATNSAGTAYGDHISFETLWDNSEISDFDGNSYSTVRIGEQIWMAENLKTTHYSNGTPLVDGTGVTEISGDFTTRYWFVYGNNSGNKSTYGLLYTWAAVMNGASGTDANPSGVQGVCPAGWHVPSDEEWKQMEIYLGMSASEANNENWRGTDEGGKLKETGTVHWTSPNTGATNASGFTALGGGHRTKHESIC